MGRWAACETKAFIYQRNNPVLGCGLYNHVAEIARQPFALYLYNFAAFTGFRSRLHSRSFDFYSFFMGVAIVVSALAIAAVIARNGWSRRDRRNRLAHILQKLSALDADGARELFGDVSPSSKARISIYNAVVFELTLLAVKRLKNELKAGRSAVMAEL
jgi:hypothetical protein